jgi:hypothetical protein
MISTPLSLPRGCEEAIEGTKGEAAGLKKGGEALTITRFLPARQNAPKAAFRRNAASARFQSRASR